MFYGGSLGNRLVNSCNYPNDIKEFLKEEESILIDSMKGCDIVIEVGCMEVRNLQCVVNNGKKYIGVDIIPSYIETSNKIIQEEGLSSICECICIDAENLDIIFEKSNLIKDSKNPMFFFPFNSFGNMSNIDNVIKSMSKIKKALFVLFTYQINDYSNSVRFNYYHNCNYEHLNIVYESNGVRFTSDDGLNSMAYDENFLGDLIKKNGLNFKVIKFSNIGTAYFIKNK